MPSDTHSSLLSSLNLANSYFVASRYEDAISEYSEIAEKGEVVSTHSEGAIGLRNRGLAYLKLGELKKGRDDLEKSLVLLEGYAVANGISLISSPESGSKSDSKDSSSNKDLKAFQLEYEITIQKLGECCFNLRDYYAAKKHFEKFRHKNGMWLKKVEVELSGSVLPLNEVMKAAGMLSTSKSQIISSNNVTTSSSSTKQSQSQSNKPVTTTTANSAAAVPDESDDIIIEEITEPTVPNPTVSTEKKKIPFDFSQSETHVLLDIKLKKSSSDFVTIRLHEDGKGLTIINNRDESDPHYVKYESNLERELVLEPLNSEGFVYDGSDIGSENSVNSINFTPYKIEIKLQKKIPGVQWSTLINEGAVKVNVKPAAYPTSNKNKKEWKETALELDDDKPEGDEALNSLFKQIFSNGSDETRRAMVKSFQTSGGTVLSTNWDEVARSDYEGKDRPSAPDGQQWKSHTDHLKIQKKKKESG